MEMLFVPLALLAGSLLAVQAGANAQLAKLAGSPFAATTLQLSVAAAILAILAAAVGGLSALAAVPEVPWWHLIGGTASAFYVASTILLFPRLGAVVSVGLFIAGQMLASVALDVTGLLGVLPKPLDGATAMSLAAVLGGAFAIVRGQQRSTEAWSLARLGWILLALSAGAVLPLQGAVNGLLRAGLTEPLAVGVVSFVVAMIAMAAVFVVAVAFLRTPPPKLAEVMKAPWWGWLGGFAGATYVMTVFTAIPEIGTAAAIGLTVVGQQVASVFVDRYGWFRLPQRPISKIRLIGVGLLIAGVAVIQFG